MTPKTLQSILTGQPDHAADYAVESDGVTSVFHYAVRGPWALCAIPGDTPDSPYVDVLLKDPAGKVVRLDPKHRTYSQFANAKSFFDPPLEGLEAITRSAGGTITGEDKGAGTFAGHPTETFVIKFESEDLRRKVTIRAARDLRLLALKLELTGSAGGFSYTLSNVSLDPPESLFTIPAGYALVEEQTPGGGETAVSHGGLPDAAKSEYLTTTASGFSIDFGKGPPFTAAHSLGLAPSKSLPKGAVLQARFETPAGDSVVVEQTYDGGGDNIHIDSPNLPGWKAQAYGVKIFVFQDASKDVLLGIHTQQSALTFDLASIKSPEDMFKGGKH